MQYVGHVSLLLATGISGLQVLKNGEESLPLLVLSLLVAGLALTLGGRRERG